MGIFGGRKQIQKTHRKTALILFNGIHYQTLDSKGLYIVTGKDMKDVMFTTKAKGFTIDTSRLRRA